VTFPDTTGQPPGWTAPAVPASELLRLHRQQVIAYTTVPSPDEAGSSSLRYVSVGPPGESTTPG
jgi:hypothetical protein